MRQREMIDSGLQHITDVPKKWKRTYYKYEIDILNGFPFKSELFDKIDGFPLIRIRDITSGKIETYYKGEFEDEYIVVKGDLLVGMDGDFNSRLWDNEDALLNQRCCKIVANEETTHLAFIKYLLPIYLDVINDLTYYTTVKHLSVNDIYNSLLFLPKYDEQTKIANYLDHKTGIIDQLIADKERLVALLQEQRQATINEAVTGGLDADGNIRQKPDSLTAKGWKDSGIEWLGAVPEDWEVVKLKYELDLIGGFAFKSDDYVDEGIQLIKIANTYNNELSLERQPTFLPYDYAKTYSNWVVSKKDILMSLTGTMGKEDYAYAIMIQSCDKYLLNQRVAKINTKGNLSQDYLLKFFHSRFFLDQIYQLPSGTKQANLSNDDIYNSYIAFPKSEEIRVKLLNNLISKTDSFGKTIQEVTSQIQNLKSYRQSLISEAVTGKIDLREWEGVENKQV